MICQNCKTAAVVGDNISGLYDKLPDREAWHEACEHPQTCPCQHKKDAKVIKE